MFALFSESQLRPGRIRAQKVIGFVLVADFPAPYDPTTMMIHDDPPWTDRRGAVPTIIDGGASHRMTAHLRRPGSAEVTPQGGFACPPGIIWCGVVFLRVA